MKKSRVIIFCFFLVFSMLIVSAFSFSDFFGKITGKAIEEICGDLVCDEGEDERTCPEDCSLLLYEPFESQEEAEENGAILDGVSFVEGKVGNGSNITGSVKFPISYFNLEEGAVDFYIKPQGWGGSDNSQHMLFHVNPGLGVFYDTTQVNQFYIMKNQYQQLKWIIIDEDHVFHTVSKYLPDLVDGQWTRVTANWKNIGSGEEDAEMHLYLNGIDVEMTVHRIDPKTLTFNSQIDINDSAEYFYIGNSKRGFYPVNAVMDELKIYDKNVGVPEKGNINFSGGISKEKPIWSPPEGKVVPLAQATLPATCQTNETIIEKILDLEKPYFDALTISYCFYNNTQIQSNQKWIDIGDEKDVDIALDSWYLIYHVGSLYGIKGKAERLLTNGLFEEVEATFDYGDRELIEDLSSVLEDWFKEMDNLDYYLNNEGHLQTTLSNSDLLYYYSPTYSDASLEYFRDYLVENYGEDYSDAKFPVDNQVTINAENNYKIEYSDDPLYWAKWFEWRSVVFANFMNSHAEAIYEANEDNSNWKGYIYFVSFSSFLDLLSGVDLELITSSPYIDWMIMEETDISELSSIGVEQLEYGFDVASSTNTLFGSYVLAWHYWTNPPGPNKLSSVQMQFEEGIENGAKMITPYHDVVIVPVDEEDEQYPTWYYVTVPYQNATYNESISNLWSSLLEEYRINESEFSSQEESDSENNYVSGNSRSRGSSRSITKISKDPSLKKLIPGEVKIIEDVDSGTGIKQIKLEVKEETQDVSIIITKYEDKPVEISKSKIGKVYQYLHIETENLNDKLKKATMTIQVEKTWMFNNGLDKDNLALFKFDENNNGWNELITAYIEEDNAYYYYDIELTSFSYFAISSKAGIEGELEETGKEDLSWLWIVLMGTIIGGILMILILIKRKCFRNFRFLKK